MQNKKENLPIKVIIPSDEDYRRPPRVGGAGKDFLAKSNYEECREKVLNSLIDLAEVFDPIFASQNIPAVARVTLREDAIAKSHRPDDLLSSRTCPIIGGENFGELLISIRPRNLRSLADTIKNAPSDQIRNDVVKILSIDAYSPVDALGGWTASTLARYISDRSKREIKLRLFNHRDETVNKSLRDALKGLAQNIGVSYISELRYAPSALLYKLALDGRAEQIQALSAFVGSQSLDVFEEYSVSAQATIVSPMTENHLPAPEPDTSYPIVGIIDSGTDPNNASLQAWVDVRDESLVPRVDQNNTHGSLVAALIINGRAINHHHPEFPTGHARIVDVVALPSNGRITEDDLLETLRYAFHKYPHVRIWNMSLNSKSLCRNDIFSEFASGLDALQDEFNVMVVNSAGNFNQRPAFAWERPDLSDRDRICAPADSLRAVTVGSIAHLSHAGACAKIGEPSPFTRRGPGAAFVPKPDVCHFGGNADRNLLYNQIGVLAIDANKNIVETVGTSFAAPLVALTAAQLRDSLQEEPSRHLVKAFLIHSAVLHNDISARELPFKGFGKPPTVEDMLRCNPWEATLVFDVDLPFSRRHFTKADFPIPKCLEKNGKISGEVILTLVYDPPVDIGDGAAYSQVNIDASLGMCETHLLHFERRRKVKILY